MIYELAVLYSMMLAIVFAQFLYLSKCDTEGKSLLNRKSSEICKLATNII